MPDTTAVRTQTLNHITGQKYTKCPWRTFSANLSESVTLSISLRSLHFSFLLYNTEVEPTSKSSGIMHVKIMQGHLGHREPSGTLSYYSEIMSKLRAALPKERRFTKTEVSFHSHSLISKLYSLYLNMVKCVHFVYFIAVSL